MGASLSCRGGGLSHCFRRGREPACDLAAASARLPLQLLLAHLWPCQPSCLSPRLTDPWPSPSIGAVGSCVGPPRVAVLVPQSRRPGIGAGRGVISSHVVAVVLVGGTGPSCWSTGSDEAERVPNRGAVACSQRGGSPFGPLVSAKMGERL
jgi:hypothetical protein